MANRSGEETACNRKRKHEQHDGCNMPTIIPLNVEKDAVTIGRLKDATVQLQCSHIPSMISRKHATIVHNRLKRKWFIKDHKSCNGVYLNGVRIEPEKLCEIKVKDIICFGTPISNNSFRYVLEQLTTEEYQLVQEQSIAEGEVLSIKKKPSEMGVAGASGPSIVNGDEKESTSDKTNSDEVAVDPSSMKKNDMLLSIQEEFLCVICQELFVKAHSLSCSHSYCEKCITDWLKKNKHCPICRKTIASKPCPSIALDNAVSKLVECLPEERQKERAELLEERCPKKPSKDVILITDSPVRPTTSGVVTRSARRRNVPVNLVSSDSSSSDSSDLSDSESDEGDDDGRYDDEVDYFDDFEELYYDCDSELEGYTGLPGHSWGGYGRCYRCGDPGHWAPGCPN